MSKSPSSYKTPITGLRATLIWYDRVLTASAKTLFPIIVTFRGIKIKDLNTYFGITQVNSQHRGGDFSVGLIG